MARVSILNSEISEIFLELSSIESIFFQTNYEAEKVWKENIDESAGSYFKLEDENWIASDNKQVLGDWLNPYNLGDYKIIQDILNNGLRWRDDDIIYFCLSKVLNIESSWREFKINWDKFIEVDDDCPIVINKSSRCSAIIFEPMGDIVLVRRD